MEKIKFFKLLMVLFLFTSVARADIITKVHDGDTVTTAAGEKIRLACIDSPEVTNNKHGKKDPINGPKSRDWLKSLVLNVDVRVQRITKDLYGRTIARLFLADGTEVNKKAVITRHAVIYMPKPCEWANKK